MTVQPEERQGYLGKLEDKTIDELKDLLRRQEKLLSKQNFLRTLPDKGLKVKKFAEILESLIHDKIIQEKQLSGVNSVHSKYNRTQIVNPTSAFSSVKQESATEDFEDDDGIDTTDPLKSLINPSALLNGDKKQIVDMRINFETSATTDDICDSLNQVKLSITNERIPDNSEQYVNSYERVLQRVEQRPETKSRSFKPNSSLLISKVEDLPEKFKPSAPKPVLSNKKKIKELGVVEESAACPPHYKYNKTQLVSTLESIELIKQQEAKQEELKAERAAARLAERLNIKMDTYNPPTTDMAYPLLYYNLFNVLSAI
ncbi:hypothetical protein LOTGIDRAFT_157426 [Lottia gigantea]|uniref:Uncharacterized protein n=1 Tax=Lottia gigantea TaxID=225164 RepID=V4B5H5_LOTGI|nr:hypothetical protein LOTGIDRAFT_157426 [Lottia gigantea]ESP01252.1 hypothetical protein LOTGIDRAFT_157426 [Lottia gigantea]